MNGKALFQKQPLVPRVGAASAQSLVQTSSMRRRRGALIVCSGMLAGLILLVAMWAPIFQAPIAQRLLDYLPGYRDLRPVRAESLSQATVISPTAVVRQMLGQVDRGRALDDLRRLTGEEPICVNTECYTITDRLTGSEGLGWAMDYLYDDLADLGYSVERRDWSRSGWTDQNLIARKAGVYSPTEEIYLVAHVDGVNGGPAADDNASGTVDGLEASRVLSSYSFSRTVVLFFSTGEEQGALGVKAYLDQLSPSELDAIKYVLNFDMIGYDNNGDRVMELWHADHAPSLAQAQTMSETIDAYQLDLEPRLTAGCG